MNTPDKTVSEIPYDDYDDDDYDEGCQFCNLVHCDANCVEEGDCG